MTFAIKVKSHAASEYILFERNFANAQELLPVSLLCVSKIRVNVLLALAMPVRTDSFESFKKDFFFPAYMNAALTAHDVFGRILESALLIFLDVCTFPLRVITLVPRHLYNLYHKKEDHPFYQYLRANQVALEALNLDQVYVERKYVAPSLQIPGFENDSVYDQVTKKETLNFVQVPENGSIYQHGIQRQGLPPNFEPAV